MTDEELAVEEGTETEESGPEPSKEEKAFAELKEAIVVQREELGGLRLKLTVTVPRETVDARMGKEFAELKREANVPGFRKGHAPLKLVEKRFGTDVGEQLKGQLVGSGYLAAVEKEGLKPLGDPLVWVKVKEDRVGDDAKPRSVHVDKLMALDQALDHIPTPKDEPFTFSCEMEIKPDFELPNLEKIRVDRPAVAIDDEDVDVEIDRLRMMRGTFVPVEKGPIKANDLLYVSMKASIDGEVFASEENMDLPARDSQIKGIPLPGLGDAVTGKKLGDTIEFEATVPEDFENLAARGKTAKFEFTVREIKRLEMPELDKEFVESVGFESEKELRSEMRKAMESRLGQVIQSKMQEQVADYLVNETKLEIPEGLSSRQTERALARRMIEMYQSGIPQTEIVQKVDELRGRAREQVVRDLKLYFILERIAEDRNIEVGEERLNGAIAQIAQRTNRRFDRVRDDLSKGDGLSTLYLRLRDEMVLSDLLNSATITETEGPKKKSAAKSTKPEPKAEAPKKEPVPKPAAKKPAVAAKKKTTKKKSE